MKLMPSRPGEVCSMFWSSKENRVLASVGCLSSEARIRLSSITLKTLDGFILVAEK